jgi:crotonobetainyl-CoA:carnitine CoA-transferase CaiB-like acyl-CoA transferase
MPGTEAPLFEGLVVLDVGTWIAAPVAATMLADYGATVIKVEMPGHGDPYRYLAGSPLSPVHEQNYMWLMDGRNKRSITLNLGSDEGRDILMQLVRRCDVFITNHTMNTRRKLRLNYEDLRPENARMIYASLTAYGEQGPDAELEGFDGVAWWSRTGLMDRVRARGVTPGGSVPGMGDHPTAVSLYASIVTALLRRERTGEGARVHTSLLANGIWSNACYAQGAIMGANFDHLKAGVEPISPNRAIYQTADSRWLQLYMVRTEEDFDRMLLAAERGDILGDPRFANAESRRQHWEALLDVLRSLFAERTAAEWMKLFRTNGVPVTLVAEMPDLAEDEQIVAAGIVQPPTDPAVPAEYVIRPPVNIDGIEPVGARHAPAVGEHTNELLAELGFGEAAIEALHARGVV